MQFTITRTFYKTGATSVINALQRLADAERCSNYFCGFVDFKEEKEYTRRLEAYMMEKGYIKNEEGRQVLTEAGKERSLKPAVLALPEPIEKNLR